MAGSCGHDNQLLGSIKDDNIARVSDSQLLKNEFAPQSVNSRSFIQAPSKDSGACLFICPRPTSRFSDIYYAKFEETKLFISANHNVIKPSYRLTTADK